MCFSSVYCKANKILVVDLHFLDCISVRPFRLQADDSPPLSSTIRYQGNIQISYVGSDDIRFWLPFQLSLDPMVRLLPTGQALEMGHSASLFQRHDPIPCLRLNEYRFRFFHYDFANCNDLEPASLVERKSRGFIGISKWSIVLSLPLSIRDCRHRICTCLGYTS